MRVHPGCCAQATGTWAVLKTVELATGGVEVTVNYTVCKTDIAVFVEYERKNNLTFHDDVMIMLESNSDEQRVTLFDNVHICHQTAEWRPTYPQCSPGQFHFIMVIDRSYSIDGSLATHLRNSANYMSHMIESAWANYPTYYTCGVETHVSVYSFDNGAPKRVWPIRTGIAGATNAPLEQIKNGDAAQKAAILAAIKSITFEGLNTATTIGQSLSMVFTQHVSTSGAVYCPMYLSCRRKWPGSGTPMRHARGLPPVCNEGRSLT